MNRLDMELEGRIIQLQEEFINPELNGEDRFKVIGGFGSNPKTMGTALFIESVTTHKTYRISGMDKFRINEEAGV